jgi:predicted DCC family thiol-disulfide oxidoreductase YuxK
MSTPVATPEPTPTLPPAADGKAVVLYDGACPLCQKSIRILRAIDWLKGLTFHDARDVANLPKADVPLVPKRLIEEMHVLTPDRRHALAGFKAFRWMAWRIPLTVLSAPFLYIPGVPWLGNRVYLWVAKNRFRLVPCKDGVCQLPAKK